MFWIGAGVVLLLALVYAVAAAFPDVSGASGQDSRVRVFAVVAAAGLSLLFAGQVLAAAGLTLGWPWARPLATVVCAIWALTCVGLPVALLAINSVWRGRVAQDTARSWP